MNYISVIKVTVIFLYNIVFEEFCWKSTYYCDFLYTFPFLFQFPFGFLFFPSKRSKITCFTMLAEFWRPRNLLTHWLVLCAPKGGVTSVCTRPSYLLFSRVSLLIHFPVLSISTYKIAGICILQSNVCQMARYIIPSVTISWVEKKKFSLYLLVFRAIYGLYKSYWPDSNDKKKILTVEDAVSLLNLNSNTSEALRFIQHTESEWLWTVSSIDFCTLIGKEFLKTLNPAAVALLARSGSELCLKIPVKSCLQHNLDVTEALRKVSVPLFQLCTEHGKFQFNLGDKWNSSIEWINRVACPEEDLSCSDEWLVRLPSQIERLRRMLQLLFLTTEVRPNKKIPRALWFPERIRSQRNRRWCHSIPLQCLCRVLRIQPGHGSSRHQNTVEYCWRTWKIREINAWFRVAAADKHDGHQREKFDGKTLIT